MKNFAAFLISVATMTVFISSVLIASGLVGFRELTAETDGVTGEVFDTVSDTYGDVTNQDEEFPILPGVTVELDEE